MTTAVLLLSPEDVAERLGISTRTLRRLTSAGEIAYVLVGARKRFREVDVEEYLSRNAVPVQEKEKEVST